MADDNKQLQYRDLVLLRRRWFPLWTLDGYIFREFIVKYSILLLVFAILFLLLDIYRDVSDFLEAKTPLRITVLYFLCLLPGKVRFVLPISMLLGCMWTMATFGKNMEVTAMRASGVSLFRCGFPIFFVGIIVTCVNIYFNEALIPNFEKRANEIYEVHARHRQIVQHLLAFRSNDQQRHWLFKIYASGNVQNDVAVKTFWNDEAIPQLIGAPGDAGFTERMKLIFRDQADKLLALPYPEMSAGMKKLLTERKLDILADRVTYRPETGEWVFENGKFVSYDRNDETRFEASRGTSAIHRQIPFKVLRFSKREIPETPVDIVNSIKEKDDLPTVVIWDLLRRNSNMPARVRAIYETVFYYRLAFPWACFLAVFLGIPLATKNERTGSMMAIINAVLVIVVYIVIAQIFLVMGKSGWVNPALAGLMPTASFIVYGLWRIVFDRN